MNIGFIINGEPKHGIVRATCLLANALGRMNEVNVSVMMTEAKGPTVDEFLAFQDLVEDGVIVFHASHRTNDLWGSYETRIFTISEILRRAQVPVVLYLHDIYGVGRMKNLIEKLRNAFAQKRKAQAGRLAMASVASAPSSTSGLLKKLLSYEERFVRAVDPYVTRYVVSNQIEKVRLKKFVSAEKISVLPHFIEKRELPSNCELAKSRLGLAGKKVITLLGFIHERKGHEEAIEVLERLPPEAHLVFAGQGEQAYLATLSSLAEGKGVASRLRVTGYLSEEELNSYLAASDVAICPFRNVSASGSLATWLSAGKPIVAYDLLLMREYEGKFPKHLHLARRGDVDALAVKVKAVLDHPPVISGSGIEAFSLENSARKLKAILESTGHAR